MHLSRIVVGYVALKLFAVGSDFLIILTKPLLNFIGLLLKFSNLFFTPDQECGFVGNFVDSGFIKILSKIIDARIPENQK